MNTEITNLDLREKLARIDQMLAEHDRRRQEIRFARWQIAFAGMTAGAALFAAGAAFSRAVDEAVQEFKVAWFRVCQELEERDKELQQLRQQVNNCVEIHRHAETIELLKSKLQQAEADTKRLDWLEGYGKYITMRFGDRK
jgi:hypothetical protein